MQKTLFFNNETYIIIPEEQAFWIKMITRNDCNFNSDIKKLFDDIIDFVACPKTAKALFEWDEKDIETVHNALNTVMFEVQKMGYQELETNIGKVMEVIDYQAFDGERPAWLPK